VTTGSGRGAAGGTGATGPNREGDVTGDADLQQENRKVDQKVKSICRGC